MALTASAFDEDRQACEAAGMNDFITKPVDPPGLYGTLLKWLPPLDRSFEILRCCADPEVSPFASGQGSFGARSRGECVDQRLLERGPALKHHDCEKVPSLLRRLRNTWVRAWANPDGGGIAVA